MAISSGKRFEECFRNSIPEDIFFYRFKDGTASWNPNGFTRFQAKNICDCFVWDGETLFFLELKSHKGKSLPLNCIRQNQVEELTDASNYANTVCGLLIFFSDIDRCFFLDIKKYNEFVKTNDRLSIPLVFLEQNGIEIGIEKKKINFTVKIDSFLKERKI